MNSRVPSIEAENVNRNKRAPSFFFPNYKYQQYFTHLKQQFIWLEQYIPSKNLNKYLQLIAFSKFDNLARNQLLNLQLRDLAEILGLWDLELSLEGGKLSNEILTQIDRYLCQMTNFTLKHGLITKKDILSQKYKILRKIYSIYGRSFKTSPKFELDLDLNKVIQDFFSLSISMV